MTDGADDRSDVAPDDDRRTSSGSIRRDVRPGGRREWVLTLDQVAEVLQTDVRTVRKLIRTQALRAIRISPRGTRVTERALGEYLHPKPEQ